MQQELEPVPEDFMDWTKNMIIKNNVCQLSQILCGTGSKITLDYIIRSEPIHKALRITAENISSKIDPFDVHIACEYIV